MDDINLCSAPISIIFQITVWCFTRFIQKNTQSFLQRCFFLWFWITKTKESPPLLLKLSELVLGYINPTKPTNETTAAQPSSNPQVLREILDLQEELPGEAVAAELTNVGAEVATQTAGPEGRSAPGSKEVPPKNTWGGLRWREGGDQQKIWWEGGNFVEWNVVGRIFCFNGHTVCKQLNKQIYIYIYWNLFFGWCWRRQGKMERIIWIALCNWWGCSCW